MSITRSSIPVCISGSCRTPRCVSPSLIPALSHWPLSVTCLVLPLLRAAVPPAGPQAQEFGAGARPSLHAAPQKYASHPFALPTYFNFLFYFLFPSCASLFFTLLDSSLPTSVSPCSGCISASSCFHSTAVSEDGEYSPQLGCLGNLKASKGLLHLLGGGAPPP